MTSRAQLLKRLEAIESSQAADSIDRDRLRETVRLMRATVPPTASDQDAAQAAAESLGGWWEGQAQRFHDRQCAAFYSPAMFRAIEAGRRSGKSHGRKVEIVAKALDPDWIGYTEHGLTFRNIIVGGPTQDQTMKLYWRDLLRMIPDWAIRAVRKSEYQIETVTGAVIFVLGMDKPQRAEGFPVHDAYLDEYADMKKEVWSEHLEPGLETPGHPPGTVCFFGTPDMKSGEHFVELADSYADSDDPEEQHFRWSSVGILSEARIERLKRTMPKSQYTVQILAGRATTGNRAYFEFDKPSHSVPNLGVVPGVPLAFAFDFNVEPGVAVVMQRQTFEHYWSESHPGFGSGVSRIAPDWAPEGLMSPFWAVIGEVYIPEESNTPAVCRKLIADYGGFDGKIYLYGDSTGGARGTAKVDGSDWDIIESMMVRHFGRSAVHNRVPASNPPERSRVNAVNSVFRTADDRIHCVVSKRCRYLVRDLERVTIKQGSAGELHKPSKGPGSELSHISDAAGYVWAAHAEQKSKRLVGGRL